MYVPVSWQFALGVFPVFFFVDAIGGSKHVSAPPCLKKITYIFEIISQEIIREASKLCFFFEATSKLM